MPSVPAGVLLCVVAAALGGCGGGNATQDDSAGETARAAGRYDLNATADCLAAVPLDVDREDVNPFFRGSQGNLALTWPGDTLILVVFGSDATEARQLAAKAEEAAAAFAPLGVDDVVEQDANVMFYTSAGSLPESAKKTIRGCLR